MLAVTDEWTQSIREKNNQIVENAAKHLASLREGTIADPLDLLQQNQMLQVLP